MSKVLEWLRAFRSLRFMRRSLADREREILVLRSDIERLQSDEAKRENQARRELAEQIAQLRTESMERVEQLRTESMEPIKQLRSELPEHLDRLRADLSQRMGSLEDAHGRLQVAADVLGNGLERVGGEMYALGARMNR